MLTIGQTAPLLTLPCDGGGSWSLAAQRASRVLVTFYGQDGTPTCTNQLMDFNALLPVFTTAGVVLIGISKDKVAAHDRFKVKMGIGFPLGSDHGGQVMEDWQAFGEKLFFGKRVQGVLRRTVLIDGAGKVAAIWTVDRVKGHAAEVLAAVTQM